jgi:putative transposase
MAVHGVAIGPAGGLRSLPASGHAVEAVDRRGRGRLRRVVRRRARVVIFAVEVPQLGGEVATGLRHCRLAGVRHGGVGCAAPVLGHEGQVSAERGSRVPAGAVVAGDCHRPVAGLDVVQVRYRYRIYPAPGQRQALARAFGCARVVYNDCLRLREACRTAGEVISDTEVQHRVITLAKRAPERAWLGEVASVALVQACQDARRAYRNWLDCRYGRRKGRPVGHPVLRRKHQRQSIRLTRNGFSLRRGRLYVAKVGDITVAWSRDLPSVPSSVTVICEPDGRYYASFVVERAATPLAACGREVGIDLGLASLAVTSDGEVIANPRFLRAKERKLARAQRALSRKQKGSANRARARRRVAVVHRKVRETRRDHAHKIALRLVRDNQAVYAEDLCVSGLARTRLARSVHDAGWSQLLRLIEDKAAQYGRTFARIGRFEPTSQLCSACGVKDGPKPLTVRQWTCPACAAVHDRDVNAAKNVLALGRRESLNACGAPVSPGPALAQRCEAGTHRSPA